MKFVKIDGVAQSLTVRRQPAGCLDCLTAKLGSQNLTFQALIFESVSKREKGFWIKFRSLFPLKMLVPMAGLEPARPFRINGF